jgi:hypothetical protein
MTLTDELNAYSERWVKSIKVECLKHVIPIGEKSLRRIISSYVEHFHEERNHQGLDNFIPFPTEHVGNDYGEIKIVKARDAKKNEICRAHKFELIRVENSYARRYNFIKDILLNYFKGN